MISDDSEVEEENPPQPRARSKSVNTDEVLEEIENTIALEEAEGDSSSNASETRNEVTEMMERDRQGKNFHDF